MTILVRTDLGENAARRLATFEAGGNQVYISCVYFVESMPGYSDYWFHTSNRRQREDEVITEVIT